MPLDRLSLPSPRLRPATLLRLTCFLFTLAFLTLTAHATGARTQTTLSLTAAGTPSSSVPAKTAITFTATVSSGLSPIHPGQVKFCDAAFPHCTDVHLLGTAQLTAAGTASMKFIPGPGTHAYKAIFAGTAAYATSTSAAQPLTVSPPTGVASSITSAQSSGGQGNYTLNGIVASSATAPATGALSFLDTSNANYNLGSSLLAPSPTTTPTYAKTFSTPLPFAFDNIAVGDFNNDGIPDLVISTDLAQTLTLQLGIGDGTFAPASATISTPPSAATILIGDLNSDGNQDLIVGSLQGTSVYLGNGDGTLTKGQTILASASPGLSVTDFGFALGDFNNDGIPDILVEHDAFLGGVNTFSLQLLLGNGDGTFTVGPAFNLLPTERGIAVGDFNNDGKLDLILVDEEPNGSIALLLGNGDGSFQAPVTITSGPFSGAIFAVDLNNDGNLDLLVDNEASTAPYILLGKGDGTFTPLPADPNLQTYASRVLDLNQDGIPDVVTGTGFGKISIALGKGDGTFAPPSVIFANGTNTSSSLTFADFNGDGRPDFADLVDDQTSGAQNRNHVDVYLAKPGNSASASLPNVSPVGTGTHYIDATYPGDAYNTAATSLTIPLLAHQVPTITSLTIQPAGSATLNQPVTLTANLDRFFAQNHNASGTVVFSSGSQQPGSQQPASQQLGSANLANGTASFTLSTLPAGTTQITAAYSGDTNFTGTPSLPVPYTVGPSLNGSQTITFPAPATPAYAGTSVTLAATSTSGLPITYTVVSGPATVTGTTLTYTGAGPVVIQADQPGTANYTAAAPVQQTVTPAILTQPVGSGSVAITTVLTITTPGTLAAVNFLTQGAPNLDFSNRPQGNSLTVCAPGTTYAAGQTCTVAFVFDPTLPGARNGGITLTSATGALLASSYLYGVGTGPLVNYLPATQSTLITGIAQPAGMAFDGAGNLFIADGRGMDVLEATAASGYQTRIPIGSGYTDPVSIAIDGLGNVYVADYYPGAIYEVTAASGYTKTITLVSGLNQPGSISVDGNGNLFYPDIQNRGVDELTPGGIPRLLTSAIGTPAASSLDGAANLFVLDQSTGSIFELTAASNYATLIKLPATAYLSQSIAVNSNGDLFISSTGSSTVTEVFASGGYKNAAIVATPPVPNGIALDGRGNLYVAENATRTVDKYDYADAPTLTFNPTPVGQVSADSPQTVTLINNGNSNLNVSQILRTYGFTVRAASTCPQPSAFAPAPNLPPDTSCTYQVSFAPFAPGPISGALTITDNNLNVPNATQAVPLNGTGTAIAPSIVFTVPNHLFTDPPFTVAATSNSPAPFTYTVVSGPATISGQTVTVTGPGTVTLQATQPATGNYTAGSAVTSFNATSPQPQTITFPAPLTPAYDATSVPLGATSSSGLPVTYTVVSGPGVITGNILTYTGLGTVTLQATQSGGTSGTTIYTPAPPVTTTVTTQLLTENLGVRTGQIPTVILFTASGTVANVAITTQGATSSEFTFDNRGHVGGTECVAGMVVTAGQTCTLRFDFLPAFPGPRFGGITLTDAAGNLLANSYILGEGIGPQLFYLPSTQSTVGSGFGYLSGAAVDGSGHLYLSDKLSGITQITLATGATRSLNPLLGAADVIVDGSGNVFAIDDTRVVEFPAVNGVIPANPTLVVLATGFHNLDGIKVDSNGNIFVANGGDATHQGSVTELLAVNGVIPPNPATFNIRFAPNLSILTGVAVDINGNVFASDQENHAVFEALAVNGVVPPNPTIVTVGSGFITPTNVAFDGIGDLFVPDAGTHSIREILAINGVIPANPTIVDLGSGLVTPQGLVVDPSGNVFIADSSITQATELNYGIPPTLTFAATPINTTSPDSPKTFTISNAGNADLVFPAPATGTNPVITSSFTVDRTSACPSLTPGATSFVLHPTQSCTTAVDFTPVVLGPIAGTLVRTDNNLDILGSTQTVNLVGNGLAIAPAILFTVPNHTFGDPPFPVAATSTSPAPFTYTVLSGPATIAGNSGNPALVTLTGAGTVTLQATQPATGNYAAGTATATFQVAKKAQTITFTAPATPIPFTAAPITLTATATSGLPVVFSVISGPARIAGSTLTITGGGTILVAADQPGNTSYAPAPQVTHTIVVTFGLPTVTLTAAPNPVFLHNPVTLTAAVGSPAGIPVGTVTFLDGLTPLGTTNIVNGQATFSTNSLAVGPHTITAIYSGDTNFASLTSAPLVVLVEDFSLVITNPALTIQHGGTGVFNLVVTSVGGTNLASTITLTTTGQPVYSTYVFAPAIIGAGSGTTNGTLTIHTPDFPSGPFYLGRLATGSTLTLAGLLVLILPKRRRRRSLLATMLLLFAALGSTTLITGCGSGWKTQHWFVTVTATAGNLTRTAQATLTSQP